MLLRMLDLHRAYPAVPQSPRQRFLASASGGLAELKALLIDVQSPIGPGTGAQIAQMLRAIREAASNFALTPIVRAAAEIETYLLSSQAYGASGALPNALLDSKIEALYQHVADAMAGE